MFENKMVKIIKTTVIGFILCFFYSNFSNANGAEGGGGGNRSTSTREEILSALKCIDMKNLFFEVHRDRSKFKDSVLKGVFLKMFGPEINEAVLKTSFRDEVNEFESTPIAQIIKRTTILLLEDTACHDTNHEERDASASSREICLSLMRLTKISSGNLQAELSALLAHELTHVIGFGELEANLVQVFFLKNSKRLFYRTDDMNILLKEMREIHRRLPYIAAGVRRIKTDGNENSCSGLLMMAGKMSFISNIISQKNMVLVGQWGERYKTSKDQYYHSLYIEEGIEKLGYTCTRFLSESKKPNSISSADIDNLANNIEYLKIEVNKLLNSFDLELQ